MDALEKGTKLKIFTYPAPILKKIAEPVMQFNEELEELCHNMLHTMYHAPGIGLAAPQVGIGQRIFVMDIDYDREEITRADGETEYTYENFNPRIIINPKFEKKEGEILYEEGCLSVPGVYEQVKRAEKLTLHYQNIKGENHSLDAEGLLSVCLQHENDHLDGIVFIERLSMIKKNLLMKKFLKTKKK